MRLPTERTASPEPSSYRKRVAEAVILKALELFSVPESVLRNYFSILEKRDVQGLLPYQVLKPSEALSTWALRVLTGGTNLADEQKALTQELESSFPGSPVRIADRLVRYIAQTPPESSKKLADYQTAYWQQFLSEEPVPDRAILDADTKIAEFVIAQLSEPRLAELWQKFPYTTAQDFGVAIFQENQQKVLALVPHAHSSTDRSYGQVALQEPGDDDVRNELFLLTPEETWSCKHALLHGRTPPDEYAIIAESQYTHLLGERLSWLLSTVKDAQTVEFQRRCNQRDREEMPIRKRFLQLLSEEFQKKPGELLELLLTTDEVVPSNEEFSLVLKNVSFREENGGFVCSFTLVNNEAHTVMGKQATLLSVSKDPRFMGLINQIRVLSDQQAQLPTSTQQSVLRKILEDASSLDNFLTLLNQNRYGGLSSRVKGSPRNVEMFFASEMPHLTDEGEDFVLKPLIDVQDPTHLLQSTRLMVKSSQLPATTLPLKVLVRPA